MGCVHARMQFRLHASMHAPTHTHTHLALAVPHHTQPSANQQTRAKCPAECIRGGGGGVGWVYMYGGLPRVGCFKPSTTLCTLAACYTHTLYTKATLLGLAAWPKFASFCIGFEHGPNAYASLSTPLPFCITCIHTSN